MPRVPPIQQGPRHGHRAARGGGEAALGLEGWAECGLAEIQELDVGERSSEGQTVRFEETRRAGSDRFESVPPKRQEVNILGARLRADGQSKVSGGPCAVRILSGHDGR